MSVERSKWTCIYITLLAVWTTEQKKKTIFKENVTRRFTEEEKSVSTRNRLTLKHAAVKSRIDSFTRPGSAKLTPLFPTELQW
jgi:hypothetical protein